MWWLFLALSTSVFTAASDIFTKIYLSYLDTYKMALARVMAPIFFLTPLLIFQSWPSLDFVFWKTILILLPLETTALYLYMKALKISPLSLTLPFLSFTPAFIILTGSLILGEKLSPLGILGIGFIVIGSYLLHIKNLKQGFWGPWRAIFKEKGSLLMLIVAFIYSFTSVLGKLALKHSNPWFFGCFYFIIHGIFSSLVLGFLSRTFPWQVFKARPQGVLLVGLSQTFMVIFHMWAISLTPVAYMIAIKRLSILWGVLGGKFILKEEDFWSRLIGVFLMLAGVFLIAFSYVK